MYAHNYLAFHRENKEPALRSCEMELMSSVPCCVFCFRLLEKLTDRNFVESRGEFEVSLEFDCLPFVVRNEVSRHICKQCPGQLKKRYSLKKKLGEIEENLHSLYRKNCTERGIPVKTRNSIKRFSEQQQDSTLPYHNIAPSAIEVECQTIDLHAEVNERATQTDNRVDLEKTIFQNTDNETPVYVRAVWSSGAREKQLPKTLESLGKMLVRGTLKQIASAAWNCQELKPHLIKEMLKAVHKECAAFCSKKNQCILRKTTKEDMLAFTFQKFEEELQQRTPIFRAVLQTASMGKKGQQKEIFWIPTICMAAAVCLKNRSYHMTVMQLLVCVILQHSGLSVSSA